MIKNEIEQLLSKYKHGNVSHEQRKNQNEWTTKNCSKLVTKIRFKKFKKNVALQNLSTYHMWKYIKSSIKTIN